MAQKTSRANGQNPLESAVDNIEKELGRIQKQFRSGRRQLEKRIEKGRRQIVADVRKTDAYKRARALRKDAEKRAVELRKDAEKQIESGVGQVLSLFQIASKRDLDRIDRRLRNLNKKLSEMEKSA